jgi:hypothetical protein
MEKVAMKIAVVKIVVVFDFAINLCDGDFLGKRVRNKFA